VTADQNLQYQQNMKALPIAVAVLIAKSNRMQSLIPLVPALLLALESLESRSLVRVGG
jgi:hypothetical protein